MLTVRQCLYILNSYKIQINLHFTRDVKYNCSIKYSNIIMAKKKSRSANVARKREKRKRDRKTRHKQLAIEKQRKLPYGRMDEERLYTCLIQTPDLIEEPELESLHFDLDLMYTEMAKFLIDIKPEGDAAFSEYAAPDILDVKSDISFFNNDIENIESESQDTNEIFERFQTEVIGCLITPKFMRTLLSALSACENRLRRTGERDLAEVAFFAQFLFSEVPPDVFVEHPLIQAIGMQTLRLLVENPPSLDEEHPAVRPILSEVLANEDEDTESQREETLSNMFSDAIGREHSAANVEAQPVDPLDTLIIQTEDDPPVSESIPSPDSLPAKALYKNFEGLAIKEVMKKWQGPTLKKETATQLDYFDTEQELYITVTESRVQLHAYSEAELDMAMDEFEDHCQSTVMYLAKTYEEGGNTNGTE